MSISSKKIKYVYTITLIVSFCSIVYELILAQCLSVLLGNTVVRYSVTIGLYIFSLGMGALFVALKDFKDPIRLLIRVEVFLSVIGILLPAILFVGDFGLRSSLQLISTTFGDWGGGLSLVFLHSMILVVGFLSGIELPLLMSLPKCSVESQKILAIDYIGTFLGTVAFPLYIYESLGLVAGSAAIGGLNALGSLLLLTFFTNKQHLALGFSSILILLALIIFQYEAYIRSILVEIVFG